MFALLRHASPTPVQTLARSYATKNIFVGNLSNYTTPEELTAIFGKFGKVEAVRRPSPRYGFVEMEEKDAEKAAKFLNGYLHSKRQWDVKLTKATGKPATYTWKAKKKF
ncbi:hypothetical protein K493DRAFT_312984 [Basidiobolus meristosporus CBS 931.73]|uniref:RRM domain-containing protein n=1 Tax=Basidiobolus meristosporus CBS 931.73 TaxID=1314790 RepID=A0A1Y1YR09_9FUNG|nr:hypothetical protein K493DRAFT_312984 [Basidiobolus meristosporus CBS 931.73]|eukprot:ORX99994.1 hypothetical protein K493DRAFT_312984 [Basidiobolus meristosporus CBS 931.73]